jgi:hypothetical protein
MSTATLTPAGFGDWDDDAEFEAIVAGLQEPPSGPVPPLPPDPELDAAPEGRPALHLSRAAVRREVQQEIDLALYGPRRRKTDREV